MTPTPMTSTLGCDSGGAIGTVASPVYTLGTNPVERERLRRQSEDLVAHSVVLLDHADAPSGARVLELGCGPSGSIELLAQRVGPTGSVTAIDIDQTHVALARQLVRERCLTNVEVRHGDARRTGLPSASFDLVHARLLLVNIPGPEPVVAEMTRLVRPGGWVLVDEADGAMSMCYPPHPAWDRLSEILRAAYLSDGADLSIGRKLSHLLRQAGLVDVGTEARVDVSPAGHPRRTLLADLVANMTAKIIERGVADADELEKLDQQVRQHLAEPDTMAVPCLYFLAWGRKPDYQEDTSGRRSPSRTEASHG
jgi:ubiquinone/menaquinone biosynthesis C-methylase UbiE